MASPVTDFEVVLVESWGFDFDDDVVFGLENVDAWEPLTETDSGAGLSTSELSQLLEQLVDIFLQTRDVGKCAPFLDHYASWERVEIKLTLYLRAVNGSRLSVTTTPAAGCEAVVWLGVSPTNEN